MPSFIVKAEPGRDLYLVWSTIGEAPTYIGSRAELQAELGAEGKADRFGRADRTGTSSLYAGSGQSLPKLPSGCSSIRMTP